MGSERHPHNNTPDLICNVNRCNRVKSAALRFADLLRVSGEPACVFPHLCLSCWRVWRLCAMERSPCSAADCLVLGPKT